MSDVPDVNGEFEVEGLPVIEGAVWTISKREGPTPESPNQWWDYPVEDYGYWMTLTVGSDEWTFVMYSTLSDYSIALMAQQIYNIRLVELRNGTAQTTDIHPVPPA